mmetsp:Transcript_19133/g.37798  ORF Transcript_19133/g.37798 Transcript_19133/m.37798 type:complete len:264 (+) Transcript_19133:1170-1961(+)
MVSHAASVFVHTSRVVVKLDFHSVDINLVCLFGQVFCFDFFHVFPRAIELVSRVLPDGRFLAGICRLFFLLLGSIRLFFSRFFLSRSSRFGRSIATATSSFHLLLFIDEGSNTINHDVDQFHFALAQTGRVRQIEDTSEATVNTSRATDLDTQLASHLLEIGMFAQIGELHHHGSAQTSSQVGRTCQDVPQVLAVSKGKTFGSDNLLHFGAQGGKASEHRFDVGAHLHRDDAEVVFFVEPHQSILVVVVVDTTGIRPITVHGT